MIFSTNASVYVKEKMEEKIVEKKWNRQTEIKHIFLWLKVKKKNDTSLSFGLLISGRSQ